MNAPSFPPSLHQLPESERLTETFGFTPLSLALGSALGLLGSLIGIFTAASIEVSDLYLPLGCLAGLARFGTSVPSK